jgi:hypothetical protein
VLAAVDGGFLVVFFVAAIQRTLVIGY